MSEKIMTELPDVIRKEIARWAEEEGMDKSILLTKIIVEGIKGWKMNKALEMYKAQRYETSIITRSEAVNTIQKLVEVGLWISPEVLGEVLTSMEV